MSGAVPLAILRYSARKAISLQCFKTQRRGTKTRSYGIVLAFLHWLIPANQHDSPCLTSLLSDG